MADSRGAGIGRVGCLDVGGTAIKTGILEGDRLVGARQWPTPARGDGIGERVVDRAVQIVAELAAEQEPLDAVGFVVPGVVDPVAGVGIWSENLGWRDVPFHNLLEERLGIPVAVGHDVRAGGLAEARLGAGAGYRDVVFLPVGTGVAAAIVCDGVPYDRDRPTGEIGHVDIGHDEPCVCGLRGCVEAIASAAAIARRYAARTGAIVSAAEVSSRVVAGDPDARVVWADAVAGLGRAIAWLAAVLAPEIVIVGGGLAEAGEVLLEPLRADVEKRITFQHRPVIAPSAMGSLAGCVGAGLLARDLGASRS